MFSTPIETTTVRYLRRVAAIFVQGNRYANAASVVLTGRVIGGSLW